MLSDGLGVIAGLFLITVSVTTLRNRSGMRRQVRGVEEQRFWRRGAAVSETRIEKRVKTSVYVGWATVVFGAVLTVSLFVRLVAAIVSH
jgi:hypothetical protein